MDPNKALAEILALVDGLDVPGVWLGMDDDERAECKARYHELCEALDTWLNCGGFLPDVAPLLARSKRMVGHVGGGSIFDNHGMGGVRYVFLAPLPYPVEDPVWQSWRFVRYHGDATARSYQFPRA